MAISLTHAFVSAKSDGADSSLVQPSNWNAEHTLTMATARLLGRTTAGTGAAEEISVSSEFSLTGTTLSLADPLDLPSLGPLFINEQASADADVAGDGQIWVKTDVPNELWFTADDGTDIGLTGNGAGERGVFYAADYGFAEGNTGAQNVTALGLAVADANTAGGGTIRIGPGIFPINTFTLSTSYITIQGAGTQATRLRYQSTTGDIISFNNVQHSALKDLTLDAETVKSTANYALVVTNDCYQCLFQNLRLNYVYNGIFHSQGSSCVWDRILLRNIVGNRGVLVGTNSGGIYGYKFQHIDADNPYLAEPAGNVKTWTGTTAYSVDDVVRVNGQIWQCSSAGTSAASGGPSGTPGTNNVNAFSTGVTDGTVTWRYICEDDLIWFVVESYAYSGSLHDSALLNGYTGLLIADSSNTGSSLPKWFNCHNLEIDHSYNNCVELNDGEGFYATHGWWGSALTARGVLINTGCEGETYIGGGTRIVGNRQDGILLQAGPENVTITDCFVALNSQGSSGTYHGIIVGANATRFIITQNHSGRVVSGSGQQGYGIVVNSGTSDYYIIRNNNTEGNVTGGITDGGSGSNKFVGNNF